MSWIAKYVTPEPIPTKGYVNDLVAKAFDKPYAPNCREHLQRILETAEEVWHENPQFLLALFWADSGDKMVDVLGYSQPDKGAKWPGNLEVSGWIFRNGIYEPEEVGITCTDGIIIAGREEELRRSCMDIDQYLDTFPDFGNVPIDREF